MIMSSEQLEGSSKIENSNDKNVEFYFTESIIFILEAEKEVCM